MNIRIFSIASLLLTFSSLAFGFTHFIVGGSGSLPPKYLAVPHWKQCSKSITCGSAQFYCLPQVKPVHCPEKSWKSLTSKHLIPECINGCSPYN